MNLMIKYLCDICGKELDENELIYNLKIEIKARYKKLEISLKDLLVDHMQEIKELIEKTAGLTAEKLQDDIYKSVSFHLCPICKQRYIKDPLGLKDERSVRDRRRFGDN
jgi:hypothetical protein